MAFLSESQLIEIGFRKIGKNVLISDKASIYNPGNISIGSNVRIDDFGILSAGEDGIEIGNYVHIACFVSIIGKSKITLSDFVGISARSSIYSSSDDYSGGSMVGPMIPMEFRDVDNRPVVLERHVLIGVGTVILPGVTIDTGTAVGALSLVTKSLDSWGVYIGIPVKLIKNRKKGLLEKEMSFLEKEEK